MASLSPGVLWVPPWLRFQDGAFLLLPEPPVASRMLTPSFILRRTRAAHCLQLGDADLDTGLQKHNVLRGVRCITGLCPHGAGPHQGHPTVRAL